MMLFSQFLEQGEEDELLSLVYMVSAAPLMASGELQVQFYGSSIASAISDPVFQ